MKKVYLLILLLVHSLYLQAQLSEQSSISLVTVAPGTELYSKFGHSMIVIQDPIMGIDKAYSYGTFDFGTENFYWKFLKGTLPYTISYNPFDQVADYYANYEHRSLYAQKLNLDLTQRNSIYNRLETNLLPQNKEYQYKFFYDNCSSRIRDIFVKEKAISVPWGKLDSLQNLSYRQWMNKYLPFNNWVTFGMNLALGARSEVKADANQSCYLPDNLFYALNFAKNGDTPLVSSNIPLYEAPLSVKNSIDFTGPIFILGGLACLLLLLSLKKWKYLAQLDYFLFSIYGVFSWLIFFLATCTDHEVMAWNASTLMLFPLNFPAVFWFAKNSASTLWKKYLKIVFIISSLGFVLASFYFWGLFLIGAPIMIRLYFLSIRK
ncbi:lipoprotein N-acyltransferase Lnb domain-containing protein [Aquirufa sp. ROCK-SH2]